MTVRRRASVGCAVRTGRDLETGQARGDGGARRGPLRRGAPTASAIDPSEGRPARGPLAATQRAHPLLLLGEVRQLEERAEGVGEELEGRRVERAELVVEGAPGCRVAATPQRDRAAADPLDEVEGRRSVLLRDHLAEQRAEQPDLAGERVASAGRADGAWLGADRRARGAGTRHRPGHPSRSAAYTVGEHGVDRPPRGPHDAAQVDEHEVVAGSTQRRVHVAPPCPNAAGEAGDVSGFGLPQPSP